MNTFLKKISGDAIAVLLFLVIAFTYFMTPISQGLVLGGHDAMASVGQGRENAEYVAATGEQTRWTNTLFSGMPTYQIAPAYESSSYLGFFAKAYGLFTSGPVLYLFLFLLGFYILLRAFNFRPWLAALGAIVWAFSSYFCIIIAAGHIWKVMTLTFIPPTIAGVILCYRGKLLWGSFVTALFTAFQIMSNHIQMSYYFAFVMFFLVLAYGIDAARRKALPQWAKATGVILLAGVVGLLANVSNLYHTYEYSKLSMRGPAELSPQTPEKAQATNGGLDRDYITQWSYGVGESFTLLVPDFNGGGSGSILDRPNVDELNGYDRFYQAAGRFQEIAAKSGQQITPPGLDQYWGDQPFTVGPVYVGAFVCFLFIFGLFFVRGPLKWALLASTVLSFLFAWGHNNPAFTNFCIDHLPLYNKFRTPSSALVVAEFAIPLLAMLALARLIKSPADVFGTKRGKIAFSVASALTAGLCLLLWLFPSLAGDCISAKDDAALSAMGSAVGFDFVNTYRGAISDMHHAILAASALRSLLIILAGIGLLWLYLRGMIKSWMLCVGLFVVCLFDLWQVDKHYLNDASFTDPVQMQTLTPSAAEDVVRKDKTDFRVLNLSEGNPFNETSNRTAYFFQSIGGYNAAKLHRYQDLIDRCLNDELQGFLGAINMAGGDMQRVPGDSLAPVLNMLNTKWIIFGAQAGQALQNPYANGNAWFVTDVKYVDTPDAEIAALKRLDTKHAAVADKRFRTALDGSPLGTGSVRLTQRKPNEVRYEVTSDKGGLIVFSEIYYPGWKATVDGQPVKIGRVNYLLRALKVPAGKHLVVMEYRPTSISVTEAIAFSAIAVIFVLLLLIALRLRRKRQTEAKE